MSGILYIMAKVPVPGHVKTRLCPPLDHAQAAELAAAFVDDLVRSMVSAGGFEVRLAIAGAPGSTEGHRARSTGAQAAGRFGAATGLGVRIEMQDGDDLGERMSLLVRRGLGEGHPTVIVGGDVPDLPRETVVAAFRALERTDAVLAASRDGGYVLVGARKPIDRLFRIDAPWSTPGVFSATCDALTKSGCSFETLPSWDDVDDAAALVRLARRLETASGAPATSGLIERWRKAGMRF